MKNVQDLAKHCEKAWAAYAKKNGIQRSEESLMFKLVEELGELTRSFLVMKGMEKKGDKDKEKLVRDFHNDCATLIGNALILALHFKVDIEERIYEKFPVSEKE